MVVELFTSEDKATSVTGLIAVTPREPKYVRTSVAVGAGLDASIVNVVPDTV